MTMAFWPTRSSTKDKLEPRKMPKTAKPKLCPLPTGIATMFDNSPSPVKFKNKQETYTPYLIPMTI
jgi:hypothetical protein